MPGTRPCRTCGTPFKPVGKARYCSPACRCGTDAGYNAGCRCAPCKAAHARNHKRLRVFPNPHMSAVGTVRRIEALECLGWSTAEQSRQIGMHRSYLLKVRKQTTVEAGTAVLVAKLYDRLSMTPCPSPTAARTAAEARARGAAPPLAWDEGAIDDPNARPYGLPARDADTGVDEVVVDRIIAGDYRLPATPAERTEVVRRWVAARRSLAELGVLTGWNVHRYLRRDEAA